MWLRKFFYLVGKDKKEIKGRKKYGKKLCFAEEKQKHYKRKLAVKISGAESFVVNKTRRKSGKKLRFMAEVNAKGK